MNKLLEKILRSFKSNKIELSESEKRALENAQIVSIYNKTREVVSSYKEPNYTLAEKVFREFNDFNLKNIEDISLMYLDFIPCSLLPYPKNYIKCAYYIFLEKLEKENDLKIFKAVQDVGTNLFFHYPNYVKYRENLKDKKFLDTALQDMGLKDSFKKIYGVYEVSGEDYNSSPSSIDVTNEVLIHDFGVLPEIEEDVDVGEIVTNIKYEKNT